ncbi:protein brassinosteroid insensitive 1 [Vigna unguiculata]|uniref:Protein brassinosteroid insensitive 1 n=1 Tax=Vigna unguiculata TaxID=3917 RepID=A0A4D6NH23_VIGUN|nr:protein brassinosteroid insensitive 1 [Vigna unguiculata]
MKGGVRLCFLIFLLLEALCSEGCRKEEREALLGLRSHFDYANWNVETDCCEWEGVECNSSTGRVAQLYLYGVWKSTEQYINYSHFSVFKDLKELHLEDSNIVGCVEAEELSNLELLDMSYNNLDTAAGILSCLDGLPSLKSLYLRYNSFNTSSLTHVFESVSPKLRSNLEVIDLSRNYLSNDILASMEGFTSLKELYLSGNLLDSDLHFQALCSSFKNLEVLDLSYNNLNHTDIGSALTGLSSLNSLYLTNSQLSWRSIYNISKLSSLEKLHLGGNNLNESGTGSILENDTFKWPTNLQRLSLWSNSLSNKFLSSLRGLPRLQFLDLSYNQLEGSLDISENETFKWPTNLQYLSLRNNRLSNRFVSSLRGLPHLQFLDLSYNQLKGALDISALLTLSSLTNLDLSHNGIQNLVAHEDSKSLSKLDVLDLDENMIDGTKLRESLRALSSSIREISMSYNYFNGTIIAGDFHDLSNLEDLRLDGNTITDNEFFKNIGNLTSLKILSVSDCYINDILPPTGFFYIKRICRS